MAHLYNPINNKYYKWYTNIIENAKIRNWNKSSKKKFYCEKHHIIPKSLGGINGLPNYVFLSAKEHFICHRLLPKFLTGNSKKKMVFALFRFCNGNHQVKNSINSKSYSLIKESYSKEMTKHFKSIYCYEKQAHKGNKNGMWNISHSEETKKYIADKNSKIYNIIDPFGVNVTIKNLKNFCRENNLCYRNMNSVVNGKQKHHKNWRLQISPESLI